MKLAVLGATGQTGQHLVSLALGQGHSVTAVVRNPDKLQQKHDNLSVVKASIFSAEELTEAFRGHDAVLSALGFSRSDNPVTGYTESMKAAVAAMRASGVKRLVVMTSFYTDIVSGGNGGFLVNWILIPLIKRVLMNMREMEQYLESEAGDLDWTVVRPGGLSNRTLLDQTPVQEEGGMFVSEPGVAMSIPRANVANFMLSQLQDSPYVRKTVAIAMKS
ncbi:oxidoreductase tpcG-like [Amphibalanus amphitrite]|uniref:oxidoreductase tpcG-like n=1 Tax=Amphibalanus amphitrite TaxID=1232801 RepID=UPI001C8FF4BD|nr:oxidoreductase tpcG-like [Amphibalanus amphitrite]